MKKGSHHRSFRLISSSTSFQGYPSNRSSDSGFFLASSSSIPAMAGEESLLSKSIVQSQASIAGVKSIDGSSLDLSNSNFPPLISKSGNGTQKLGFKENWSSLVSIKAPTEDCSLERQDSVLMDDNKGVGLSSLNFEDQTKDCENLVIGFFADKKLPFYMVKEAITKVWKPKSKVTISIHGNKAFVFNFDNEEDRRYALEQGSFKIGSKLFIVRPWSLLIEQSIAEMKTIPVWVRIYNVPLHLWNKLGLSSIATFLGNPLMMDEHTKKKTRLSYARVCVEISFDCIFPSVIPLWIDGVHIMDLPVEYQWKPPKCTKCSSFGHNISFCSISKGKKKAHWTPKKTQNISKDVERNANKNLCGVGSVEESSHLNKENTNVNIDVQNGDKSHEEAVGAGVVEITEDRAQPTEILWTYAKRNKKTVKMNSVSEPAATSLLNPFDVLFEEGELLEHGPMGGSTPNREVECNDSRVDSPVEKTSETCVEDSGVDKSIAIVEESKSAEETNENASEESMNET